MPRHLIAHLLLFLMASIICQSAFAETRYISDRLMVPLRSGPTTGHRIVHQGIPAGTRLEILERDSASSFVHVRTAGGTQGWLLDQYLVSEPIARDQLAAALRQATQASAQSAELRARLDVLASDKGSALADSTTLQAQIVELQTELTQIRLISANAVETDATNKRLSALNTRLRNELDVMIEQRAQLKQDQEQRWMLIGAGLLFAGLLIGVVIKARPLRSAWS
ncbi:MAG: TIGR04211 family SH3 domain-containing protein [Proteobacteria bacterium]|nr:TIGR04211 family SH3 domain-containing protein [Pseudomonadota bacterium]